MGFIIHFYIIFGTNLLTGGPAQIAVFLPIQCFKGKGYQTESKWNETFGNVIFGTNVIQRTWSGRQATTRKPRGRGHAYPPGRASLPHGRLVASLTSTPSLLGCVCSKKDPREGLVPFGFRLIFLFCETLK